MFVKPLASFRLAALMLLVLSDMGPKADCMAPTPNEAVAAFVVTSRRPWGHRCYHENSNLRIVPQERVKDDIESSSSLIDEEKEEEPLSEMDARVLRSMLQDEKLDLKTEEDVQKLLERGTVKKAPPSEEEQRQRANIFDGQDDSEYASTVIKTLTDTALFKKISVQAENLFESLQIWVSNRVEQDVKVLAALGIFAWERVVRDVARALPAAGESARRILLLANTSSYQTPNSTLAIFDSGSSSTPKSVMEEMNRPADEIKSVTRAILDILTRERTGFDGDRGLRTAAPAGSVNAAERQRRAYRQRTKMDWEERQGVMRMPGKIADTAWELKQELKAEKNLPGYRTQEIRNAIEAGVVETGNMLEAVKEGARLKATQRKEKQLLDQARTATPPPSPAVPTPSKKEIFVELLQEERLLVKDRLRHCIEEPENTWLAKEIIDASEGMKFNEESLRQVVTTMILLRDQMDLSEDSTTRETYSDDQVSVVSFEEACEELNMVRNSVEDLRSRTADAVSYHVAESLYDEILGIQDVSETNSEERPWILRIEEIQDVVAAEEQELEVAAAAAAAARVNVAEQGVSTSAPLADDHSNFADASVFIPDIVDVVPEIEERSGSQDYVPDTDDVGTRAAGASTDGLVVEVVSDDDFDEAVGQRARVAAASVVADGEEDETEKSEEEDLVAQFALRSLDVIFFVLEKTFTAGIPRLVSAGTTAMSRIEEVQKGGLGEKGWKELKNTADPKGRY